NETRYEELHTDDAEMVVVGYGIVSRLLRSAVSRVRAEGLKVGLLRPITLWPFPHERLAELSDEVKGFLVAELSTGQMVEDVRLAVEGKVPVALHGRWGGAVPSVEELARAIQAAYPTEGRAS
ncbi:MAG: 3-methyl-2-oxobutanoate dehydrogenase subunit beta, partial [bacterium]